MSRRAKLALTVFVVIFIGLISWARFQCSSCRFVLDNKINMKEIDLIAEDGVKLAGSYYPQDGNRAIILAHQFGRDRNSWGDLPLLLQKAGWAVLTIDLRGHGESDLKYQNFSDLDFNNMVFDIEAAKIYLKQQNKTEIDLLGSSIGANLSLIEKGQGGFDKVVALSPGLIFKGIDAEKGAKAIARQNLPGQEVLLVAAMDDAYSYDSILMLGKIIDGASKLLTYRSGGHGVSLLANQANLVREIVDFLND